MSTMSPLVFTVAIQVSLFALLLIGLHRLAFRQSARVSALLATFGCVVIIAITWLALIPYPSWLQNSPSVSNHQISSGLSRDENAVPAPKPQSSAVSDTTNTPLNKPFESENTAKTISINVPPQDVENSRLPTHFHEPPTHNSQAESPYAPFLLSAKSWLASIAIVLVAISGFGIVKLLLGLLSLELLKRNSKPMDNPEVELLVKRIQRKFGIGSDVEIRQTPLVATAATVGWTKDYVFLSQEHAEWDREYLEPIIAHELAHVYHRDFMHNLLVQVCVAIHFFNPFVHWIASRIRLSQEIAADRLVTSEIIDHERYAQILAEIALQQDSKRNLAFAPMFLPCEETVVRRIKMLKGNAHRQFRMPTWTFFVATIVLGLLIGGLRMPAMADLVVSDQDDKRVALFEQIATHSWLDSDRLIHATSVNDLEKITAVQITVDVFDRIDLSDLSLLTSLTQLDLSDTRVNDLDLLKVSRLSTLTSLDLSLTEVEKGIGILSKLPSLEVLNLTDTGFRSLHSLESFNSLRSLSLQRTNVVNLESINKLTSLESLDLSATKIEDISPLASLESLSRLSLGNCKAISDLTPLRGLKSLKTLELDRTAIQDIAVLANLDSLQELKLCYCRNLADLAPLSDMSSLRTLDLEGVVNQGESLPKLSELENLEDLNLSYSELTDLSPLSELNSLASLDLTRTDVEDLSPLSRLSSLRELKLRHCQRVSQFAPLKELHSLESLDMSGTQIQDLTPLESLRQLKDLSLSRTMVEDLAPLGLAESLTRLDVSHLTGVNLDTLSKLQSLEFLNLDGSVSKDWAKLSQLQSLKFLSLNATTIEDLVPIGGLTKLESLSLKNVKVSNLSSLANLRELSYLSLANSPLSDIRPLSDLRKLKSLDLSGTNLVDLRPLSDLTSLESLRLGGTQVTDVTPISGLSNLHLLSLVKTPLREASPLGKLTSLRRLFLSGTQVSDLSQLQNLSQLRMLYLDDTNLNDIEFLNKNTAWLRVLSIAGTKVTDLTPLEKATTLQELDLSETEVNDLTPLCNLASLASLHLRLIGPENETDQEVFGNSLSTLVGKLTNCRFNFRNRLR